jgi:hypothetical protein
MTSFRSIRLNSALFARCPNVHCFLQNKGGPHLCFLPQNEAKSLTASQCVATFAQNRERDSSHRAASTGAHKYGNRFPEAETWVLYSTLLGKSSHLLHSSTTG